MGTTLEFVESLSSLEFDTGSESFQATYDSTRDSTSLAVVAAVATALGREPQALTPLQSVVDTDALDGLTTDSSPGPSKCDRITFRYEGFEITVTGGAVIEAKPIENT